MDESTKLESDWISGDPENFELLWPVKVSQSIIKKWTHQQAVQCWDDIYKALTEYAGEHGEFSQCTGVSHAGFEPWDYEYKGIIRDPVELVGAIYEDIKTGLKPEYSLGEVMSVVSIYMALKSRPKGIGMAALGLSSVSRLNLDSYAEISYAGLFSYKAALRASLNNPPMLEDSIKKSLMKVFVAGSEQQRTKQLEEKSKTLKKGRKKSIEKRRQKSLEWDSIYSTLAIEQWPDHPLWTYEDMAKWIKENARDETGNKTSHKIGYIQRLIQGLKGKALSD